MPLSITLADRRRNPGRERRTAHRAVAHGPAVPPGWCMPGELRVTNYERQGQAYAADDAAVHAGALTLTMLDGRRELSRR